MKKVKILSNKRITSVREHENGERLVRYVRLEDVIAEYKIREDSVMKLVIAAGALYKLPRISLVHKKRLEEYMKHQRIVPGTNKIVEKKFVRIGEGAVIYSIGKHRFVEMARAAGAVYKLGSEKGGTVLVNLEKFDEYMEQFQQKVVPLKNKL